MNRILRIELVRSMAPWAAAVLAALGLFLLFASNSPYRSWMELAIVQRDIMQLTWPLALGAGAWQGIRERRSRVEELIRTTPRPRWRRVMPVATAMALTVALAHLVTFTGATGHLLHPGAYFPYGAIPLVTLGALAMVAAVWLGQALGALVPSPLTPPIVAIVGVISVLLLPAAIIDQERRPGTVLLLPYLQRPRDGDAALQMLSSGAVLGQAVWLTAVAGTGLALLAAGRPARRVAALLPTVLAAAIVVPALPAQVADAWVEDPRATALVCTTDEPTVCISRVRSYALEYVRGPAREALSVLTAKLPQAPTHVVVRDAGNGIPLDPQPADELLVYISIFEDVATDYTPANLLTLMLAGAGTRPCVNQEGYDPTAFGRPQPNIRYPAARDVAVNWLLDESAPPAKKDGGEEPADPQVLLVDRTLAALRALPADEQRRRITALRAHELTCADGDRIDLLTVGGSR